MATVSPLPTAPHQLGVPGQAQAQAPVDVQRFPDGLKTTGQHEPLPDLIQPFEKFPKQITGPTVWKAEDYSNHPEKWTHRFTAAEVEELSTTADQFIAAGIPLTGITKVGALSSICRRANTHH
jgi:hypothetical protein